jgi:hypothetical protein
LLAGAGFRLDNFVRSDLSEDLCMERCLRAADDSRDSQFRRMTVVSSEASKFSPIDTTQTSTLSMS